MRMAPVKVIGAWVTKLVVSRCQAGSFGEIIDVCSEFLEAETTVSMMAVREQEEDESERVKYRVCNRDVSC